MCCVVCGGRELGGRPRARFHLSRWTGTWSSRTEIGIRHDMTWYDTLAYDHLWVLTPTELNEWGGAILVLGAEPAHEGRFRPGGSSVLSRAINRSRCPPLFIALRFGRENVFSVTFSLSTEQAMVKFDEFGIFSVCFALILYDARHSATTTPKIPFRKVSCAIRLTDTSFRLDDE